MNPERIRTVIADQRDELHRVLSDPTIIEREGLAHWGAWGRENIIKVITGPRRAGKSVFSMQLVQTADEGYAYAYVNFDDERLVGIGTSDLDRVVEALLQVYGDAKQIILDEVQNLEGWELFASRLQRQGFNLTITGSNARLLSSELATHLTGRHVAIEILPFSFREFLIFTGTRPEGGEVFSTVEEAKLKGKLLEYLEVGGFPEAAKMALKDRQMAKTYLRTLYSTVVGRDIVGRHRIKYLKTVREAADLLISSYSSMVSLRNIAKAFGMRSIHTAKNYASYIEESYLVFFLEKYSRGLKERAGAPKKAYCIDTGILNSVAFRAGENLGKLMENLVAVELMRRRATDSSLELYYWRDYRQREVDFVLKRGAGVDELIQVTYADSRDDVADRELKALLAASDELGCRELLVITWDYEGEELVDGKRVRFVPLWRWLLEDRQ